jgi:hypothetical protein
MTLKYYLATIKYMLEEESKTGKISFKTKSESYLINAASITSAEKSIKTLLGGIYDSFEVSGIKESNIVAVLDETKDLLKV